MNQQDIIEQYKKNQDGFQMMKTSVNNSHSIVNQNQNRSLISPNDKGFILGTIVAVVIIIFTPWILVATAFLGGHWLNWNRNRKH